MAFRKGKEELVLGVEYAKHMLYFSDSVLEDMETVQVETMQDTVKNTNSFDGIEKFQYEIVYLIFIIFYQNQLP